MTAKREMVDSSREDLTITRQCELLELPRSSFYRPAPKGESPDNLRLMRLLDEEFTRHPFMGVGLMTKYLKREGFRVGHNRVRRLMRLMGIMSVAPKPNTSKPSKEHKIYPYLLKGLEIERSNQVWCSDITYIRMPGGFVFLTAVMDWYSRKVLTWEVSVTMDDAFCVSALEQAIRLYGTPDIFNTDQGSQFTGKSFTDVLKESGITISMDGKGRAMDNIMIERLWRTVKYEEIYLKDYASVLELIASLDGYFEYYNNERAHDAFGLQTPAEAYDAGFDYAEAG